MSKKYISLEHAIRVAIQEQNYRKKSVEETVGVSGTDKPKGVPTAFFKPVHIEPKVGDTHNELGGGARVGRNVAKEKSSETMNKALKETSVHKDIEEGIADKLGAFGRGFADKATLGGYKYARAAADYGAKKALKGLGLKGGEDTTYERELEQEKEKLSKDYDKEPLASAAGDIAGHAMPYVPVVGAAIQAAKGAVDTAKGYSDKATPVADKLRKGLQKTSEPVKEENLSERVGLKSSGKALKSPVDDVDEYLTKMFKVTTPKAPEVRPGTSPKAKPAVEPAPAKPAVEPAPAKPAVEPAPAPVVVPAKPATAPVVVPAKPAPAATPGVDTKTNPVPIEEPSAKVAPKTGTKTVPAPAPAPAPAPGKTPANSRTKVLPRIIPIPFGFSSGSNDTNPYFVKKSVAVKLNVHRAKSRIHHEETKLSRETISNTDRPNEARGENVGRPNSNKSTLTKQSEIQRKIIDENKRLGGIIKNAVNDKKTGKNPIVNTDVKLNRQDLDEDEKKGTVRSFIDRAGETFTPYRQQIDRGLAKFIEPTTSRIPDAIKKPISAASSKVQSFFDTEKNLPSSEQIAANLKKKQENFAKLSPAQQKFVPKSVRKSLETATPETTEKRLKGAATVADVASYANPAILATRASSEAHKSAEKGQYTDAALNAAQMARGKKLLAIVPAKIAKDVIDPEDNKDKPKTTLTPVTSTPTTPNTEKGTTPKSSPSVPVSSLSPSSTENQKNRSAENKKTSPVTSV